MTCWRFWARCAPTRPEEDAHEPQSRLHPLRPARPPDIMQTTQIAKVTKPFPMRTNLRFLCALCGSCLCALFLCGSVVMRAQVNGAPAITYQDLLNGLKDPSRWLLYSGEYNGQRHSPIKQITPDNAGKLAAQWT